MVWENRPCNNRTEEEGGEESVTRKRKYRESVAPLSHLIAVTVSITDPS